MARRSFAVPIATIVTVLMLYFLYSIAPILLLFFIGVLFSLWLGAVTDFLQRRANMPRRWGLVCAVLFTILLVLTIGYLIVPPVIEQTRALLSTLPKQMEVWDAQLRIAAQRSRFLGGVLGQPKPGETFFTPFLQSARSYLTGVVPYLFSSVNVVIEIFGIFIMGLYLALRPSMYREGFILLVPPVHRDLVRDILGELGRTLRAYIFAQMTAMTILGIFTWIGLAIIGVPYSLAFGVFTGAVTVVPFFGSLVSTILPALFVLGSGGFLKVFAVLLLGVLAHIFEGNFVAPMIMERQVHLPPVLTLLSVLIMGKLLGVVGLLVAVPTLATVMVIVRRVYVQRMLEGKGFRKTVRDQPIELRFADNDTVLVHPASRETSIPAMLEN
jgi:predicted PurR-regulated permease PerM